MSQVESRVRSLDLSEKHLQKNFVIDADGGISDLNKKVSSMSKNFIPNLKEKIEKSELLVGADHSGGVQKSSLNSSTVDHNVTSYTVPFTQKTNLDYGSPMSLTTASSDGHGASCEFGSDFGSPMSFNLNETSGAEEFFPKDSDLSFIRERELKSREKDTQNDGTSYLNRVKKERPERRHQSCNSGSAGERWARCAAGKPASKTTQSSVNPEEMIRATTPITGPSVLLCEMMADLEKSKNQFLGEREQEKIAKIDENHYLNKPVTPITAGMENLISFWKAECNEGLNAAALETPLRSLIPSQLKSAAAMRARLRTPTVDVRLQNRLEDWVGLSGVPEEGPVDHFPEPKKQ